MLSRGRDGDDLEGRAHARPIRDLLGNFVDEAGRREFTIREALGLFCEREIARNGLLPVR